MYPAAKFDKKYWHLGLTSYNRLAYNIWQGQNSFNIFWDVAWTVLLLQKRHILYTRINSREKYSYFKWCFWQILNIYLFLTPCVDLLAYSLCVYTHNEIWWSTNYMNLQFAPPEKVVLKDENWYQIVNLLVRIFLI